MSCVTSRRRPSASPKSRSSRLRSSKASASSERSVEIVAPDRRSSHRWPSTSLAVYNGERSLQTTSTPIRPYSSKPPREVGVLRRCVDASEGLDARTERRQHLDEAGFRLLRGVEHAEPAPLIVEAAAARIFERRPCQWIGRPRNPIEARGRHSRMDRHQPETRKERAACSTRSGCSAITIAGAPSSRFGFIPTNQARTVSSDST